MAWQVIRGDCVEAMAGLDDCSVDSVVCDPPYGLEFMGREWDSFRQDAPTSSRHRGDRAGDHGRLEGGGYADGTRKAKVSYGGGGKRPSTQVCTECGKRDQFNQPHEPCGRGTWERITLDPHSAPPSMLAFQAWCAAWATEALRVLKPGGHLLAFGGTRTYHRLTCAVEDAGFEIRDTISWLYGSGFPKSLAVDKAIDRRRDWTLVERLAGEIARARVEVGLSLAEMGEAMQTATDGQYGKWYHRGGHMFFETGRSLPSRPEWNCLRDVLPITDEFREVYEEAEREVLGQRDGNLLAVAPGQDNDRSATALDITAPATPEAERWQGWGTALKPAHEPIVVARKPLAGTVASSVLEWGTGALNVDGCRIDSGGDKLGGGAEKAETVYDHHGDGWSRPWMHDDEALEAHAGRVRTNVEKAESLGRWPANVCLSHSDSCVPVGTRKVKGATSVGRNRDGSEVSNEVYGARRKDTTDQGYADPDGTETITAWSCSEFCPVRLLDEQTGESVSRFAPRGSGMGYHGGEGDDQMGRGHDDSGGASRFFLTVPADRICSLCGLPCVEVAANPLLHDEPSSGTAPSSAPEPGSLAPEASSPSSGSSATTAAKSSRTTPATPTDAADGVSAPTDATDSLGEWIVRLASSVEPLCRSCETSTAQSVALWLTDPIRASEVGAASTHARGLRTLSQGLALIAAGSRTTGITPTTSSLSASFGSARNATAADTEASSSEPDLTRFRYQSKSSRAERNAGLEGSLPEGSVHRYGAGIGEGHTPEAPSIERNVHPTVKPIELMRWLVRLVTPPGGTVLDPFTGSGTTGIAAVLEGFDFIGIEREAEYADIAEARIAWWEKHKGDGQAAAVLAAGNVRDAVEATGQEALF